MCFYKNEQNKILKKKYNFLLLGNPQSPYITQYIENVLEPLGFDIYMQADFSDKREENK